MSYNPKNPNGQATSANSSPVVIASDQSAFPVTANAGTNLNTSLLALETGGNLATLAGTVSSGKINVNFASGSLPSGSNTIGSVEITDGTNTANVLTQSATNSGSSNSLLTRVNYDNAPAQTATWTTATPQNTALTVNTQGYNSAAVSNVNSGTFTAGNFIFEVFDGTNWFAATAFQINNSSNLGSSWNFSASASRAFQINVAAYQQLRLRLGTAITGSSSPTANLYVTVSAAENGVPATTMYAFQGGNWNVASSTATGSAVPADAYYMGVLNSSGNLTGVQTAKSAGTDGVSAESLLPITSYVYNGSTNDRMASASTASGTTGIGLLGAGALGIYNTSAPTASNGDYYQLQLDSAANLKVTSGNPTGSAVPANAYYIGVNNSTGNLTGLTTAAAANISANSTGTGGNNILSTVVAGQYLSSGQTTAGSGDYQALQIDSASNLKVNVAATSGTLTVQPGNTPNTTPWLVSLNPSTSGGWSVSSQTALTNTVVYAKTSAGQFGGYMFFNPNSAVMYIQVFNAASGVSLGSTVPTYVIPIPAAASANIEFANGIAHSTGIGVAATTTATGSSAPTTALTGFVLYK